MMSNKNVPATTSGKASRREIFAWAMYDWANSAYTTLSITILVYYLSEFVISPKSALVGQLNSLALAMGNEVPAENWGPIIWSAGLAMSMFIVAILSPIVGAMADARATKRWWLAGTAILGSICAALIGIIPAEWGWTNIGLFIIASLFFDLSFGFYNGFLPELADDANMNRVSAWGFALGYLGGGIALAIEIAVLKLGDRIGLVNEISRVRFGMLLMGVWWGIFTLPAIIWLRDRNIPAVRASLTRSVKDAFAQVGHTLKEIRRFPTLVLFLVGFLFYNDGIQTVIGNSGSFAKNDLGFKASELGILILAFQFICLLGAFIDSFLTDRIGQKRALMLYLWIWVLCLGAAYFVTEKIHFWYLSFVLGLVMGGSQTVSRSIMAVMTPPGKSAEFFGFFNFSGKATSWMGNATMSFVVYKTGSARLGVMSLFVFFVIGLLFAMRVNVDKGRAESLVDV